MADPTIADITISVAAAIAAEVSSPFPQPKSKPLPDDGKGKSSHQRVLDQLILDAGEDGQPATAEQLLAYARHLGGYPQVLVESCIKEFEKNAAADVAADLNADIKAK